MRAAKWIAAALAGCVLLVLVLAIALTLLVDPNRFKGRIEALVSGASGEPFHIAGDLAVQWYPWLALQMGAARLGEPAALIEWRSARFGARLLPLLRGRLELQRVRLEGLQVRLQRNAAGHGNWESLGARASGPSRPLQFAGLEVRNGSLEYVDNAHRLALRNWQLELDGAQPAQTYRLHSTFVVEGLGAGAPRVELSLPQVHVAMRPLSASAPRFTLAIANAALAGSAVLEQSRPLRAHGVLSVRTRSLRELLALLAIGGPRPRDAQALGPLSLEARWAFAEGALAVSPLTVQLDDTHFSGELRRPAGSDAIVRFILLGDHIDLDRYLRIDNPGSEPFELPSATLKALKLAGVVSFAHARMRGSLISNARIRLESAESGAQAAP